MRKINKICICGGGSLGLVCAAVLSSKGVSVNLLTDHPDNWNTEIIAKDPDGKEYHGSLCRISADPAQVIPESDMVFLTIPGFLLEEKIKAIKPYLLPETIVGSVVSSTGFFFTAHEILGKAYPLWGFQRVPYIARVQKYGAIGELLGYKSSLNIVIENSDDPESLRTELEYLFSTPIKLLNNFYEVSLTNSNPILHTGRLYTLWKDYNGQGYDSRPNFYAEWDDESSECIIAMDREFQRLLRALNIPENTIPTLLDYYESTDIQSLTRKIRSIPAFQSIPAPMVKKNDLWFPDLSSRYFTEDFPYGLHYINKLCEEKNIPAETISKVYRWGTDILSDKMRNKSL